MTEITEAVLAEWERMADAATAGPWRFLRSSWYVDCARGIVAEVCSTPEDIRFIAEARTALPALVAEVRRLRASPPLAAEPRRGDDAARAGWEACRAQMVAAAKAHADMVGEKGSGSSEGAAAMTAVLWLASLMENARPAPPLAAEGTAGPDLARIGLLIDAFEAAVDAFWQPDYEGSDWEVAAARDALDAAIRALAAPVAPREETPATPNSSNEEA
jgi:hypothetical protein